MILPVFANDLDNITNVRSWPW